MRRSPRSVPLVLLDTNALFLPFRTGVDLAGEVDRLLPGRRIALPSSVREELARLAARRVPFADAVRAIARDYPTVRTAAHGDAGVLDAAVRAAAPVVTADRRLAERLRRRGVDTVTPRDRVRLTLRRARRTPAPSPASRPSGKG